MANRTSASPSPVLKSKEPRLRDWNFQFMSPPLLSGTYLKSKEPRLRDWNPVEALETKACLFGLKSKEPRLRDWNPGDKPYENRRYQLEIKRTSITRLKQICKRITALSYCDLKSKEPRLRDWNHAKYAFSSPDKTAWNQKNLDYEIETNIIGDGPHGTRTWNQKNLDYEIETIIVILCYSDKSCCLKSKEPRLRDWNNRAEFR